MIKKHSTSERELDAIYCPMIIKKVTNTIVGWSVCLAVQWPTLTKWPLLLSFLLYSSMEVLTTSMVTMPVFGKVIAGMEVVDKIAAVPTDRGDWPQKNVYIKKG
jgi:cyclophilin family peptidyl-prolyl cis-trans isomerase